MNTRKKKKNRVSWKTFRKYPTFIEIESGRKKEKIEKKWAKCRETSRIVLTSADFGCLRDYPTCRQPITNFRLWTFSFWTLSRKFTVEFILLNCWDVNDCVARYNFFTEEKKKFLEKKVTHREFVVFLWNFINNNNFCIGWKVARGKVCKENLQSNQKWYRICYQNVDNFIYFSTICWNKFVQKKIILLKKKKKRVGKIFPLKQEEK